MNWKPIENAPWGEVVWVRNPKMKEPIKATRGYTSNGRVNPDHSLFTSAFTPDKHFPIQSGELVCPTEWAPVT